MNAETLITVVSALGGLELVKFIRQSIVNRKTDRRREVASAENEEVNVQGNEIENLIKLQDHHNQQIKVKEDKISALYARIYDFREKELDLTKQLNEKDMEIHLLKIQKC
jgi:hypothetical protein